MTRPTRLLVPATLLLAATEALAGPGGKIASAMFGTPWGKVVLAVLTIVLLPFILYMLLREWQASRRARNDLRFVAAYNPAFEWTALRERASECFRAIHSAWSVEDVTQAGQWMTPWYWQNQQAQLDRWAARGLVNVCDVKRLTSLKPLLFVHRHNGAPHEGSSVAVLISAKMVDYLAERASGKVVEGSKSEKEVETIWTFVLRDGAWLVNAIDEGSLSLEFAKLVRELPPIESTVAGLRRP